MRLADKIEAEFAADLAKLHSCEMPEWGVTIYWTPWTLGDVDAVFGPDAPRATNAKLARAIVVKSVDEGGKGLFVQPEESQLLKSRPELIGRLGAAMIATMPTRKDGEDAAKNSEATQGSTSS